MEWNDVNRNFGLCAHAGCPRRADCLRYEAGLLLPADLLQWPFVNPALWRQAGAEGCAAFTPAAPQRMARGFKQAMRSVPLQNIVAVREAAMAHFKISRPAYYHMYSGRRALTPQEQQEMAALLARFGAPEPVEFDAYEDAVYWPY